MDVIYTILPWLKPETPWFEATWIWAAGLAASMLALTAIASSLINPDRKDDIALWLMGGTTEESWSKTFISLFDAVFGEKHWSFRCMIRSAIASLLAVVLIWLLMGQGSIDKRLGTEASLAGILLAALAVNIVADYVSLLETRFLLGQLDRFKPVWQQTSVLIIDALLSGFIIWIAIRIYQASPLNGEGDDSFAEVVGVFSIYSVLFYSTFLTSVWTWGYITSTWLMRLFARLRLAHFLDVLGKPLRVLGYVMASIVFLLAMIISIPMKRDQSGLTVADRYLCEFFEGKVCLKVAALTHEDVAKLDLLMSACQGGAALFECARRAILASEINPKEAAQLFQATCEGHGSLGCFSLGVFHDNGIGVAKDQVKAARLFQKSCNGDYMRACVNLGGMHREGIGVEKDPMRAARLFQKACDAEDMLGCTNLGGLYSDGTGVKKDPREAARLQRKACNGGASSGCFNLGGYYIYGIGVSKDPMKAARLFQKACDADNMEGCVNLGGLYNHGIGVAKNSVEAARLYNKACDGEVAEGCYNLGLIYQEGNGTTKDPVEAARLFKKACDGNLMQGCINIGSLLVRGIGVPKDPVEAARFYQKACDGDFMYGCTSLAVLHRDGIGVAKDPIETLRYYQKACDGGLEASCDFLKGIEGE